MNLKVNPKIFEEFDNPRLAVLIVKNVDNTNAVDLSEDTNQLIKGIQQNYKSETLSQEPKIAAWREAHRQFGSKPKEYLSSIEALYKRVIKGQGLGGINPLVDIYNYISLKYMLPAGGEDLDLIKGDLVLTYATKDDKPVTVLGKDQAQAPAEGEVVYKDDVGVICRRWNWREVERTALSQNTKSCVLVLEGIGPVANEELKNAQNELADLVTKYCKAEVTSFFLDKENPSITFKV